MFCRAILQYVCLDGKRGGFAAAMGNDRIQRGKGGLSYAPRFAVRSKYVQAIAFLLRCFASDQAVSIPAWVGIAFRAFSYVDAVIGRVWFTWDVLRFDHARRLHSCRDVLRQITPAVCRIAPNRTACEMLRSYSRVGSKSPVVRSQIVGAVIGRIWFTLGLCVSYRRFRRSCDRGWLYEKERHCCVTFLLL